MVSGICQLMQEDNNMAVRINDIIKLRDAMRKRSNLSPDERKQYIELERQVHEMQKPKQGCGGCSRSKNSGPRQ